MCVDMEVNIRDVPQFPAVAKHRHKRQQKQPSPSDSSSDSQENGQMDKQEEVQEQQQQQHTLQHMLLLLQQDQPQEPQHQPQHQGTLQLQPDLEHNHRNENCSAAVQRSVFCKYAKPIFLNYLLFLLHRFNFDIPVSMKFQ
jgi:hypothetical protein